MAWKLRKDNLQEDDPALGAESGSEPALSDTTVAKEALPFIDHGFELPEDDATVAPGDEVSSTSDFGDDELSYQPFEAGEAISMPPPQVDSAQPEADFSESPFAAWEPEPEAKPEQQAEGPFAPFSEEPTASNSMRESLASPLDRDDLAAGLVMPEEDPEVPRIAPFIVDIPTPEPEVAATGQVRIRIGNFTALNPLVKDMTVIGRPDSALRIYPDIEIEMDDAVSRRHVEIRRRGASYFLVDLHSTNGTLLNGRQLDADQECALSPGDRIRIGDRTEIVFE